MSRRTRAAANETHASGAVPGFGVRLHGGANHRVELGTCTCGGQMVFDTDMIGRSIDRCEKCGRVEMQTRNAFDFD